ncbi:hypothetical protein MNBD_NITROSPINAE02-501 [hydrothermal vent metagenome]|uniref:Uncharacterized protein n=1 Tax=hydrothermal vent metagenome TaxID=652676 RepID=A0A3B1CEL2_9ZZZZ
MNSINYANQLTDEHKSIIRHGAINGDDWRAIHNEVCQVSPVTQKLVKKMMERYASDVAIKSSAKREGARVVHEFLEKALSGNDVDDMAAALENAVYRDILRRYADAGDALVSMTMEQVLKLEMTYRASRLTQKKRAADMKDSGQVAKLSARICMEMIDKLAALADEDIKAQLEKQKKPLLEWAAGEFGKENITEILNERNEIERLSRLMVKKRSRLNGANGREDQKLVGLVG